MGAEFWENPKQDGQKMWTFLATQKIAENKPQFVGAIAGPGGFSSLRVGAGVTNSLAFFAQIPSFSVGLDLVLHTFFGDRNFLVPSFGDQFFVFDESGNFVKTSAEKILACAQTQKFWGDFVPESKQKELEKVLKFSGKPKEDLPRATFESLKISGKKAKIFVPEYGFSPV